jgi:hypothetical protein
MIRTEPSRELVELRARHIRVADALAYLFALRGTVEELAKGNKDWAALDVKLMRLETASQKLSDTIEKLSSKYEKPVPPGRARKPNQASRQALGRGFSKKAGDNGHGTE